MEVKKRLLSLDVFRGITIAGMILVNNPGDWGHVYAPLLHADWHGCTPTDLVFPFFLFIMGVAVPLALGSRIERGDNQAAILKKILWRTLAIFGIGLFLNALPDFNLSTLRIPGVLQRIALVYGITSLLFLKTSWRTQIWIGIGCLLAYWFLMTLVPVPDGNPPNLDAETNFGAWLDRQILGTAHLWSSAKVWDPEGILSTLPAIVTGLIGVLTGTWMRKTPEEYRKLTGMLAVGAILIVLGLIWDLAFPINKKIWTSSYVLYVGGIALEALAVTYWLVDVLGYKNWIKPFVVLGTNALFAYVLSDLIAIGLYAISWNTADGSQTLGGWIYETFFTSIFANPYNASLAYAIANVLICLALTWILYWRKIFIKV